MSKERFKQLHDALDGKMPARQENKRTPDDSPTAESAVSSGYDTTSVEELENEKKRLERVIISNQQDVAFTRELKEDIAAIDAQLKARKP